MKKILMIIMLLFSGNYVSADSACCQQRGCANYPPVLIDACQAGCGGCVNPIQNLCTNLQ